MQVRQNFGIAAAKINFNYRLYTLSKCHPDNARAEKIEKMKFTQVQYMATLKTAFTSPQLTSKNDGAAVRASAAQSVDLGFISQVESYQKTLKNGIHSFPAWHSPFMGGCGEQADKFVCVLGQGT